MKRTPIRRVSLKRQRANRERRRLRDPNALCEVRLTGCLTRPTDWHERLSRARGGSVTDPANRVYVCRACHDHITVNPAWAVEHGWSLHSWGAS